LPLRSGQCSISHRGWRDAIPAPAHVPDWFWHERLHLRPAGFSGLRRQSSDEACDDAGTPALWISHSANWEWSACGGYDLRLCLFTSSTPKGIIVAVLFVGGLFRSVQFTSLNTLGFADIHEFQLSNASTYRA
jgi:hypothetical protein